MLASYPDRRKAHPITWPGYEASFMLTEGKKYAFRFHSDSKASLHFNWGGGIAFLPNSSVQLMSAPALTSSSQQKGVGAREATARGESPCPLVQGSGASRLRPHPLLSTSCSPEGRSWAQAYSRCLDRSWE